MRIPEKGNIVVKFGASWCGPCRQIKPILEELKKEHEESKSGVEFLDVDVDEHSEITAKFAIKGIPAILFFKDGEIESRLVGFKSKEEIQENINLLVE